MHKVLACKMSHAVKCCVKITNMKPSPRLKGLRLRVASRQHGVGCIMQNNLNPRTTTAPQRASMPTSYLAVELLLQRAEQRRQRLPGVRRARHPGA